ncbi:MAG: MBL fold metallo-hydrolase [Candidatus Thermoplasmatota archaeon]|nr:MBL fold metallo-hydrolase [Candidatus Thermoplasmatota archaeon]
MDIEFLGGGDEVGRLGIFARINGNSMLFDYGLTPGEPPEYPKQSPPIDFVFLSHAHLDHSGMIPWLSGRYDVPIFSTVITQEISKLLFKDTLKISEANGYPFPYGKRDINQAIKNFFTIEPLRSENIGGIEVKFHSSGHIPGSIMFEVKNTDTLFVCDINTIDTKLLRGAKPVRCKTLFLEGTYSGKDHPNREQLEKEFLDKVDEVVGRGGKVIVPAFAVGRTQEMAMILEGHGYDVWLDGMGNKVTDILLSYPEYIRSRKDLKKAMNSLRVVYSNMGRTLAMEGDVILTTSGMMNGGPVLGYVDKIRDDRKSAIILTGYQVEGTNGRRLLEKGGIKMYGINRKINCDIEFFDFSAHAGHSQLVKFAKKCSPDDVIIFHSDDPSALAEEIKGFANVSTPRNEEKLKI